MSIKVIVHGGLGRMGRACVEAAMSENEIQLVSAVDRLPQDGDMGLPAGVKYFTNVAEAIKYDKPQVMIDFSIASAAFIAIETALENGIHVVSGTTGVSQDDLEELGCKAQENNVCFLTAANYAVGAVLMMSFAKKAAQYLENAEIIEMHHDKKLDAPSGTAITTANVMLKNRPQGFVRSADSVYLSRGEDYNGIAVHSVRLPGYLARQEVHFGASGQTLTITHNTISRDCFMPGVMLSVKEISKHVGLVQGLDKILNI